jgi:ubiquitin-protein ligase E3 D
VVPLIIIIRISVVIKSTGEAVTIEEYVYHLCRPLIFQSNVHIQGNLEISYVAEFHSNLQHVIVVMDVQGRTAGVDLVAEVIASPSPPSGTTITNTNGKGKSKYPITAYYNADTNAKSTEYLLIKCGDVVSPPLALPAHVSPGVKDIKVHGAHYEVKLTTVRSSPGQPRAVDEEDEHDQPLMDATQLSSLAPTTFICASCSLPLVHTHGGPGRDKDKDGKQQQQQQDQQTYRYRDLPSEHWEELVDAWMCHSDQKLHEQVAKRAAGTGVDGRRGGFWPERGEALVGGSYILFEQHAIVRANLLTAEESKVSAMSVFFSLLSLLSSFSTSSMCPDD